MEIEVDNSCALTGFDSRGLRHNSYIAWGQNSNAGLLCFDDSWPKPYFGDQTPSLWRSCGDLAHDKGENDSKTDERLVTEERAWGYFDIEDFSHFSKPFFWKLVGIKRSDSGK